MLPYVSAFRKLTSDTVDTWPVPKIHPRIGFNCKHATFRPGMECMESHPNLKSAKSDVFVLRPGGLWLVAIVNPICGSVQFLCFSGELLQTLISVTSFCRPETAAEWHDHPGTVAMVDIDTISSVKCQNSYGTSQFSQCSY